MKASNSVRSYTLVLIFSLIVFSGCEKEHLYGEHTGIYGSWSIRDISGGFSGAGYEPNFDILKITSKMHYYIYFQNQLLSEGKIEIIEQQTDKLRIEFRSRDNSEPILTGWEKEVYLGQDTLVLNDDCCDMYSYFFIRCNTCNN